MANKKEKMLQDVGYNEENNNNNNNNTNNNNNNNNILPVDTPLENSDFLTKIENIRACYDVIIVSNVIIVIPPSTIPNKIKCYLYEYPGKSVFDIAKSIKQEVKI